MGYHSNAMHPNHPNIQPNSLDVWKGLYNIYYEMKWTVCGTKTIYGKTLSIFHTKHQMYVCIVYKDKWNRGLTNIFNLFILLFIISVCLLFLQSCSFCFGCYLFSRSVWNRIMWYDITYNLQYVKREHEIQSTLSMWR